MGIVKPQKARSKVEDKSDSLFIEIPSRKNWFILIFISCWLVGWFVGEVATIAALLMGKMNDQLPFMAVWIVGWTIGGGFAIFMWGWLAFGKELVSIDHEYISLKKDIFGLGIKKQYQIPDVKQLRFSPAIHNMASFDAGLQMWGLGGGLIAFDYGAKTYRFAMGIDEAEAKDILQAIQLKYPALSEA